MTAATPSAPTRAQLEQIAEYLAAFWPSLPPQHIQMQTRGAKYKWVKTEPKEGEQEGEHIPLDQATLLAHAAGRRTIGAKLQDDSDRARVGMLDVDNGGRAALVRCLLAAEQLHLVAYAIVMPGEPHDGGRVVVVYDDFYPAAHIRAQMLAIVKRAGLPEDTEIWPCGQAVALPLGYHVRKRTCGELVLQTSESIALDTDLAAGFAAVQALPLNSAPPAIERELVPIGTNSPAAQHISLTPRQRQRGERASLDVVKAQFNAEHSIDGLLRTWGATATRDGYTCPCGVNHTHQTTLYISKQGKLFSFSPRCELYTTKGWDAFSLYVKLYHNDSVLSALKTLNPIEPRKARQEAPPLVEQPTRKQTPEQAADAERKRAQRALQAAETRAAVELAASQDARLSDSAQLVLMALLDVAGDRAWCRPSVARIEEMTSLCRRAVFYGLAELERREYIRSSDAPGRTTVRTFLRMQAPAPVLGALHPDLNIQDLLPLTRGACEGAPQPPAPEPLAEWECWQSADSECSSYDLAIEAPPAPAPEQPVLIELPAGWRIVRPARGPWCWAATVGAITATHPHDTSDQVLISAAWSKAAALAEVRAVEPAQAAEQQYLVEQEASAGPGASYDAGAALQLGGEYTARPKGLLDFVEQWEAVTRAIKVRNAPDAPQVQTLDLLDLRHAEQEDPLVRAAPVEPTAAARYWSLKGKLRKATSTKQIAWLRRQIADLEIWRPASELLAERAGVGDARGSQARPAAGRPPGPAQQATLFAGAL